MEPSTQPKKTDRRVLRTRKAIMNAYDKLLSEQEFDKITVSAIAREAGIDRKTFYLHFRSLDDLGNYKAEEALQRLLTTLVSEGLGKPFPQRLKIVLTETNTIIMANLALCVNVAQRLTVDQVIDRFELAARPALSHSGLKPEVMASPQFHMRMQFFIAGALSLYLSWLRSDREQPVEYVSDAIEESILSLTAKNGTAF